MLLLLLADGYAWAVIAAVLFCSTATIARWKARFESGGVEALREEQRGRASRRGWSVGRWCWSRGSRR